MRSLALLASLIHGRLSRFEKKIELLMVCWNIVELAMVLKSEDGLPDIVQSVGAGEEPCSCRASHSPSTSMRYLAP